MCLNASLAGLVAITASCDVTDCAGAIVIGVVAGLLVPFVVWLMDYKLKVDDPVGAVAVHMANGVLWQWDYLPQNQRLAMLSHWIVERLQHLVCFMAVELNS